MHAITAPELKECFKCKFNEVTPATRCPRCGRKLHNARDIRIRGGVLVGVGLFLVAFMVVIAVGVAMLLAGAMKNPTSARKINGEAGMLLAVYVLFGIVIVFGLHSIVIGVWQIIAGRRSRVLIWIMWVLLFLMLGFGGFLRAYLS
jgi:uncharacterized paraquat-inducible protein A